MAEREAPRHPGLRMRLEGRTLNDILQELPLGGELARHELAAGEEVFREGEAGAAAYLVLEGSVLIEKAGPEGRPRQLACFTSGDFFGEMAILDVPVRSATARAGTGGARVLEVPREVLHRLFTEAPDVTRWLLKVLSHRLRRMNKLSSDMEEVQQINRRIIEGQVQERRRIARDIHDGPAQGFADYIMRLQIIERLVSRNPEQAKQEIHTLGDSIGQGLEKLRAVMHDLHASDTRRTGLELAVRKFVDRMGEDVGFRGAVEFAPELVEALPDSLSNTLYCLVQEAVNNIRKHAGAHRVEIRLEASEPGRCRLEVRDDGRGFDVEALLSSYHLGDRLGLTSMDERAQLAGGTMAIDSEAGKGTRLHFDFPLPKGAQR